MNERKAPEDLTPREREVWYMGYVIGKKEGRSIMLQEVRDIVERTGG